MMLRRDKGGRVYTIPGPGARFKLRGLVPTSPTLIFWALIAFSAIDLYAL